MDSQLICTWLGLPSERWPPDHYTLLGLAAGESNVQKIEECVHDRMAQVRKYQLNHPDQVTEAMNRLAQAFSCLTDPKAKQAYDAVLKGGTAPPTSKPAPPPPAPPSPPPAPAPQAPVATEPAPTADPLAWLFGPWNSTAPREAAPAPSAAVAPAKASETAPVAADWKTAPPPPRTTVAAIDDTAISGAKTAEMPALDAAKTGEMPAAAAPTPAEPPAPIDPITEAARFSKEARSRLGTKRAMYHRIAVTRQLIDAWKRTGKYLAHPTRRLTRLADANDLGRQFEDVQDLLEEFPKLLGEAGQPGYLVLALAKQPMIAPTFRSLLPSQREALARDWNASLDLLLKHRQFLREELRALRKKSHLGRLTRAIRGVVSDYSLGILVVVGVIALGVAAWGYWRMR
jgi:hypothetical protein